MSVSEMGGVAWTPCISSMTQPIVSDLLLHAVIEPHPIRKQP